MSVRVTILPGDGIGTEVMDAAVAVMEHMAVCFQVDFQSTTRLAGGVSIDDCGVPITDETLQACLDADVVLLGAIGGPRWDDLPHDQKPERALLKLREALGLFTNLRPVKVYDSLVEASTLKPEVVTGIDLLVVRELTGGIYFGEPRGYDRERGWNTLVYTRPEVERIARVAFDLAAKRRGHVTNVHKANILESSQFWREVVQEVHREYPSITLSEMYVDNAAMQLVRDPGQFDVIVTQNMFGDILSDAAAMISGSLGMLPSASLGARHALYESVHGSAPDIAGQNKANPLAMIASVGMMFTTTLDLPQAARVLDRAIDRTLADDFRTADIATTDSTVVSTDQMRDRIIEAFDEEYDRYRHSGSGG
ncbi:MAG: 3-isopropylmalate dehydrogenase [Fidelibacterota bacterium]|nr:MAG: 3-isopropylmalate dehydrogenase [Candidatus Neomarinimicrobiota bacterium]